jgi:hypothetical protein
MHGQQNIKVNKSRRNGRGIGGACSILEMYEKLAEN